jgi:glycosyltransferase involved in cell wall biosynthesis
MRKLSVVIPALNEERSIEAVVKAIPKGELNEMGFDVQILVTDNGSEDATEEVARKAGADVIVEPRAGYGRALKKGFANATGEIIVTGDADGSYPVDEIPKLLAILEAEDLDFVTTNRLARLERDAMSFRNQLGNRILSTTARILFGINLKDSQSGMWLFRKDLLNRLRLRSDGMAFSEEIKLGACHFAKCRWREVPIEYRPRVGDAKVRAWRDGVQNLFFLARMRLTY